MSSAQAQTTVATEETRDSDGLLSPSSDLMTTDDVAAYLCVSRHVVRSLFRSNAIQALKVGGQWRTWPEAVSEFLINQMSFRS